MKRPDVRKNLRRGVYVIPTSFTVLNLFFGFRFFIEFLKEEQSVLLPASFPLTMGQLLSLPFIFLGAYLLLRKSQKSESRRQK